MRARTMPYPIMLASSPKFSGVIATLTTTSGAAAALEIIPDNIDKLYTVAGIIGLLSGAVLSLVLAVVHVKRYRRETKRDRDD